jgi:pyrroloquinoline-quinone synthase
MTFTQDGFFIVQLADFGVTLSKLPKEADMKQQLDTALEKWNLLNHPFYQAWSAGTLPVNALKVYASEYGAFIETLPQGWITLNDKGTADEEREHAEMWASFAAALGTIITSPQIEQTRELVQTSGKLFASPASALGALYAFEAQQPGTAQSKLQGLITHYHLPAEVEPYFEVHSTNWHESEKILKQIDDLTSEQQQNALAACEQMGESLWNALTGIYETTCK